MNREQAKQALLDGKWLYCDYMIFSEDASFCNHTIDYWNGESEYECCNNFFNNVEEVLDELESVCKGNWEEVY